MLITGLSCGQSVPHINLLDGNKMPIVGLDTFLVSKDFDLCLCNINRWVIPAPVLSRKIPGLKILKILYFKMPEQQVDVAVTAALENGYRHLDTAHSYKNKTALANALKKWFSNGGRREDLFISSKVIFIVFVTRQNLHSDKMFLVYYRLIYMKCHRKVNN